MPFAPLPISACQCVLQEALKAFQGPFRVFQNPSEEDGVVPELSQLGAAAFKRRVAQRLFLTEVRRYSSCPDVSLFHLLFGVLHDDGTMIWILHREALLCFSWSRHVKFDDTAKRPKVTSMMPGAVMKLVQCEPCDCPPNCIHALHHCCERARTTGLRSSTAVISNTKHLSDATCINFLRQTVSTFRR